MIFLEAAKARSSGSPRGRTGRCNGLVELHPGRSRRSASDSAMGIIAARLGTRKDGAGRYRRQAARIGCRRAGCRVGMGSMGLSPMTGSKKSSTRTHIGQGSRARALRWAIIGSSTDISQAPVVVARAGWLRSRAGSHRCGSSPRAVSSRHRPDRRYRRPRRVARRSPRRRHRVVGGKLRASRRSGDGRARRLELPGSR